MGAGPYGCSFLNLIRLASPLLKYANVCGPPDLRAVAHRLRTSELGENFLPFYKFIHITTLKIYLCSNQIFIIKYTIQGCPQKVL